MEKKIEAKLREIKPKEIETYMKTQFNYKKGNDVKCRKTQYNSESYRKRVRK